MSDRTAVDRGRRAPRPSPGRKPPQASDASPWAGLREKWRRLLASPQLDYKVILLVTGVLVVLGLIVALSSSMVTSSTVYSQFLRQAGNVLAGLVVMWCALWVRPEKVRSFAPALLFVAVFLLLVVLVIGVGDDIGSRSWIALGPLSFQPSEIAKLALAVWGSAAVALHTRRSPDVVNGLGAFILTASVILGLVLLQRDLGMMFSLALVALALLLFSGVASRFFVVVFGVVAVVGAVAITALSYRSDRISTWLRALRLDFGGDSGQGAAYQAKQGLYSLSDGGLFGQGLGQSRAKWNYLPEATNDFVFAIIGEELGLIGAGFVIVLFVLLAWFGIRTAIRQTDPFLRLLAATLTAGIVGQAFYNIGYVVGLLPVTGVQLPLLSAGGTSAVITLGTLGLLANCARHEPETVSSMQHEGRPLIDRILLLREPTSRASGSEHREQVRPQTRRYGAPVTQRVAPRSADLDRRRAAPGTREQPRSRRDVPPTGSRGSRRRDDDQNDRAHRNNRSHRNSRVHRDIADDPRRRHHP